MRGLKIIVTRPKESASALTEPLRALGAEPVEVPVIRFAQPSDGTLLDSALDELLAGQYDWVIFTSVNGVRYVWERLVENGFEGGKSLDCNVAAIGPSTANALRQRGMDVSYMPDVYVAEEILGGLGDVTNKQILLPRADIARKSLPNMLRDRGALVNEVVAYRTIEMDPDSQILDEAIELIESDQIDWVTFTSSSTVVHFLSIMKKMGVELDILRELKAACIGPITERTANENGLNVQVVAREHDIPGLIEALVGEVSKNF